MLAAIDTVHVWGMSLSTHVSQIFNIPHSEIARSQSPDSAIELLSKGHETPEVARSIWFLHCSNCKIPMIQNQNKTRLLWLSEICFFHGDVQLNRCLIREESFWKL